MKRLTVFSVLAAVLFFSGAPLFAQLASDPNDRLYTDLEVWQDRGILHNLPQLRPYPIQLLKKLLSDVQDKGNADDAARARLYYAQMDGLINIHPGVGFEARTDTKSVYGQFTLGGPFQGTIDPLISYSGYLAGVVNNSAANALLPEYGRSLVDYVNDGAVHPIGNTGFTPRVSSATSAAIGTDTFYFQAGNTRSSWGPFWGDNAVFSASTPQAGQLSYSYRGENFTVSEALFELEASTSQGTGGPMPGKFMALHGLRISLLPWLDVSLFESLIWGPRFDLLYMLPFAAYYYNEGMVGFPDNSQIGVSAGIRLPNAVRMDFLAYFDDMSFNDLIKLNFNTKMKFTFQTGVTWTPNLPLLTSLSVNAIMITPYTYSHTNDNGDVPGSPNYLDYTNNGLNMGPSLDPDSLRLEVDALVRPDPIVDVKPFARLVLHGNASSNAPFPDPGNGTIFDNGYTPYGEAFNTFRFLDQAVIEKTFQIGTDAAVYLPVSFGSVKVYGSYTFEYKLDAGLVAGATALNNYLAIGFGYQY